MAISGRLEEHLTSHLELISKLHNDLIYQPQSLIPGVGVIFLI